jgi:hypothetical protein
MRIAMPLVAVASLTLAACSGAPGEVEERTGTTQEEAVSNNALVANALVANALVANALVANALVANELTSNALVANALVANSLKDPQSQELFQYIVSCALPAGESVTVDIQGSPVTFDGELGLASQWGKPHGHCNESCQEWVSACLLARLDYLGVKKEISIRGDHPALAVSASEAAAYSVREATYFGNVFTAPDPQRRYACLSPGQTEISRVCGPSIQGCVVEVDDSCNHVCAHPTPDGAFQNCRPHDGDWDDPVYHGSITVFLKP